MRDRRATPTRAGDRRVAHIPYEVGQAHGEACRRGIAGRRHFDLPLDLRQGTDFQRGVWQALLAIPAGATLSYGALADRIGNPQAVRAVGAAVGRNPLSIIVPCHRVVGATGKLTGYAGGLDRKQALLLLERSASPISPCLFP